jgi:hypothetical protein
MEFTGGCLCGAVRYSSSIEPLEVGYCHCRMCQRLSGAVVVPWAIFPVDGFIYTKGQPKIYASSSHAQREFCEECGAQIAFRTSKRSNNVDITIGTLDDPESVRPGFHVWYESKVSWLHLADDLPRYQQSGDEE